MKEYVRQNLEEVVSLANKPRHIIQVVAGPRQIGKTTLIRQFIEKIDTFSIFVSADDAIAPDEKWLDAIWQNARDEMKSKGETEAFLIVDEVQKIKNWSQIVKKNWDGDTFSKLNLKVILLGSSRLLIMQGLNESLMGRFFLHQLGHWTYKEMRDAFALTPEQYAWFGGYPGAVPFMDNERDFKEYVRNAIIEPTINKDILMLTRVDKPALLRQLFEIGTSYSSQILSYTKILGQLQETGNASTLVNYANLLDQSGLLANLPQYSTRLLTIKTSSPKFQTQNPALFSALQTETLSQAEANAVWWGRIVENVVGQFLLDLARKNSLFKVYYYRYKKLEVDFVLEYGKKILAIEVKSKPSEPSAENLIAFLKYFPQAKTVLVGESGLRWQEFIAYGEEEVVRLFE